MTATIDIDAILELPAHERLELAHILLDSLATDPPPPLLSEEFKAELRRRRDEARANPGDDIPWEVVKAEAEARHPRIGGVLMTSTIDIDAIRELPVQQRIELAHIILDSIAADTERPKLSDEFKAELDRRVEADEANPEAGVPWEQVEAAALARAGK